MSTIKETLLKKMQHFCAYQDRCQFEVQQKLFKLGADKETSEEIFLSLFKEGFLNEERYARSIVRGKFRIHHWGRIKIITYLKARFVSEPLIQLALTEINEEEYLSELDDIIQKVFAEKKKIHKTIQSVITKGYETELVYERCSGLKENDSPGYELF
jgi:regulatory protein